MPSTFLPGNQASREQMAQYAQQIAGGRPTFGSVGNFFNGSMGSINPSALPDWLRSQLTQTNVDDSGQGVWNFGGTGTEGIKTKDGQYVTQLGDTNGVWDHRYIKDWNQVTYDPDLGLVTPQGNIQAQEDKSMRNFGLGIGAIGLAGLGANLGLLGAGGEGLGGAALDESAGLNMANPFASSNGLLGGALDESAGLNMSNPFGPSDYGMAEGYTGGPSFGPEGPVGQEPFSPFNPELMPNIPNAPVGPMLDGSSSLFNVAPGFSLTDPSTWGSGVSSLASWAAANPLQALGLFQAGRGLFGGNSNPGGSPGGSSGPSGPITKTGPVTRGTFTPNQTTAAQIANYRPVTPTRRYGGLL